MHRKWLLEDLFSGGEVLRGGRGGYIHILCLKEVMLLCLGGHLEVISSYYYSYS